MTTWKRGVAEKVVGELMLFLEIWVLVENALDGVLGTNCGASA